jgi:hypothetical protein
VHLSILLAVVLALQAANVLPHEPAPDLRHIINDGSVEILYSVEGQAVAVRGDGTVLKQSTRQQLPLLPTCKGRVAQVDVRRLLETMLAAQFLDLPQKSYVLLNEDWRTLQMHSISIKATGGSAKWNFSAGEYGGKRQEIPQNFATIEKAIIDLESKAIPPGTHCRLGLPLWSEDKSVSTVR